MPKTLEEIFSMYQDLSLGKVLDDKYKKWYSEEEVKEMIEFIVNDIGFNNRVKNEYIYFLKKKYGVD